ncbi:MAG TPA: ABC transporter substrate-binding protein [Acidimicrobiales bacterium]|jgi:osmoprotectant transport system substrate-binding protein
MRRHAKVLAALLALALLGAACGDDDNNSATGDSGSGSKPSVPEGPDLSIGAQDFGESAILAQIIKGATENAGFTANVQEVGGFRDLLFGAFESGDVNVAPDYVASQLEFLNDSAGQATSDVNATMALLTPLLAQKQLVGLDPSKAVDTNAFVMLKDTADAKGIATLSDLAAKGADLKLGAPQDCETNGFCIPGLKRVYGLDMTANFTPLDFGVIPDSLNEGAIDVGVVSSTDGRLADPKTGWVLLKDDKGMLAADNVFIVITSDVQDAYGDTLTSVLDDVSSKLTTDDLVAMNKRYDVDKDDAQDIAADWLNDNGFT